MTAEESTTQQRQALTAYLAPLLQKHDKGDYITYEDLQKSKQAADLVKGEAATKVIQELHVHQLTAYRAAATTALQSWAATWSGLPPPASPDASWTEYRTAWMAAATAAVPRYHLPAVEAVWKTALQPRAMALFHATRRAAKTKDEAMTTTTATVAATNTTTTTNGIPARAKTPPAAAVENKPSAEVAEKMDDVQDGEAEAEEQEEAEEGEEEEEEDGEMEEAEDGEEGEEEEDGEMVEEGEEEEDAEEAAAAATTTTTTTTTTKRTARQTKPTKPKAKGKNTKTSTANSKQVPKKKGLPNKPLGQSKTVRGATRKTGGRRGGRAGGGNK